MWDPEQLAEIPVIADRLQAAGDPLGEWLAIRLRLEGGPVPRPERRLLRRRARELREELGPRLVLADNPGLGRPHAVRELGLLADLSFTEATPGRLAELCARPDAPFILRLQLRGELDALGGCLELLLDREARGRGPGHTRTSLRQLGFEVVDGAGEPNSEDRAALQARLRTDAAEIGERLPGLFELRVGGQAVPLPYVREELERESAWTAARRATLGRALASPEPEERRRALLRLREHGEHAGQLRALLLAIIEDDDDPRVRAAAFAVVPKLGRLAPAVIAILGDMARERDDPQLREWLSVARRF
jgi:hypothetical protein